MLRYIKRHKLLLLFEILTAVSRAVCEVLLSFAMGHMTNAAVDRQVDALVRSSVQCVACLAALYVLYIGEIRLRKSLSGRCLCAVKADLYAALAARGAASFHRRTPITSICSMGIWICWSATTLTRCGAASI